MQKKELRAYIRELKRQYSHEQLKAMSSAITNRAIDFIHNYDKKDGCKTILLYHSLPDEVYTHSLISSLSDKGYTVLLPTVIDNENMELHIYINDEEYHVGAMNIQEANGDAFDCYEKIDLAIIPGMAFTKDGRRLGRGKGYYDRILQKIKCPLIGLAFPFQIVDNIPCEEHDVKMNYIIS